jgi:hypothetical protein
MILLALICSRRFPSIVSVQSPDLRRSKPSSTNVASATCRRAPALGFANRHHALEIVYLSPMHRQHPIHHLARLSEVIRGIA